MTNEARNEDEVEFETAAKRAGLQVPIEERAYIARSFAARRDNACRVHEFTPSGHFPATNFQIPVLVYTK